jgi:hypothetical protein
VSRFRLSPCGLLPLSENHPSERYVAASSDPHGVSGRLTVGASPVRRTAWARTAAEPLQETHAPGARALCAGNTYRRYRQRSCFPCVAVGYAQRDAD